MTYQCKECKRIYSKWQGQCAECGEWNSLEPLRDTPKRAKGAASESLEPVALSKVLRSTKLLSRKTTGIKTLDELLSGGFVKGQTILLAGEPGVGKSTLALQFSGSSNLDISYISGEETTEQVASRAKRVLKNTKKLMVSYSTDAPAIASHISEDNPEMAIIDSVQTVELPGGPSSAGSLKQVKESAQLICQAAKRAGSVLILIGQVTKSGAIAGPKNLEHLVDTVLYIEGDKASDLRIARCKKNRFGKSGIASVFRMTKSGLEEVKDPSSAFLSVEKDPQIGVARTVALEEQLPIGIEVQALTAHTAFSLPKRVSTGIRTNKLYLIIGVIQKYSNINLGDDDVYVNIAGGIWAREPGADLAVAAAIISSALNISLPPHLFFIGEIELSGKIRPAINHKERTNVARQCGAKKVISDNIKSIQGLVRTIKKLK